MKAQRTTFSQTLPSAAFPPTQNALPSSNIHVVFCKTRGPRSVSLTPKKQDWPRACPVRSCLAKLDVRLTAFSQLLLLLVFNKFHAFWNKLSFSCPTACATETAKGLYTRRTTLVPRSKRRWRQRRLLDAHASPAIVYVQRTFTRFD